MPPVPTYQVGTKLEVDKDCGKYSTSKGQWLVIAEVHSSPEGGYPDITFDVLRCEADADAVSKYLKAEAAKAGSADAGCKRQYDNIAKNHKVASLKKMSKSSWPHLATTWRLLATSPAEDDLVGKKVPLIAVIGDGQNEATLLTNALITKVEGDTVHLKPSAQDADVGFSSVTATKEKVLHAMRAADASAEPVFDGTGLPDDLLKLFTAWPLSQGVDKLSRKEILEFCAAAGIGVTDSATNPPVDHPVHDAEFDSYIRRSIKIVLANSLNKDLSLLASDVPSTPKGLGAYLGRAGKPPVNLVDPAPPPEDTSLPLSRALSKLAVTDSEWSKFLHASVTTTVTNADKRAEVKDSTARSMTYLERTLTDRQCTPVSIAALAHGKSKLWDHDRLLCFLDEMESQTALHSNAKGAVSHTHDSAALLAPVGARSTLGNENSADAEVRLAVKASAIAAVSDPNILRTLKSYFTAIDADADGATLQSMYAAETDSDVLRLLSAPIDDMEKLLHGVLADAVSSSLIRVRKSLDKRVEILILGKDYEPSALESTQIRRLRRGELGRVSLLGLLNKSDSNTRENPLAGFAKLSPANAAEDFVRALERVKSVFQVTRPSQALDVLRFFTLLTEHLHRARSRGATWHNCSVWYASLVRKVEKSAVSFHTGASGVSLHALEFDTTWITDHLTPYSRKLDEAIIDNKAARTGQPRNPQRPPNLDQNGKRKGKGKQQQRNKRAKKGDGTADADDDGTEPDPDDEPAPTPAGDKTNGGKTLPPKFGPKLQKMFADAEAKHGKEPGAGRIPCGFLFAAPKGCTHLDTHGRACAFWHFK